MFNETFLLGLKNKFNFMPLPYGICVLYFYNQLIKNKYICFTLISKYLYKILYRSKFITLLNLYPINFDNKRFLMTDKLLIYNKNRNKSFCSKDSINREW